MLQTPLEGYITLIRFLVLQARHDMARSNRPHNADDLTSVLRFVI